MRPHGDKTEILEMRDRFIYHFSQKVNFSCIYTFFFVLLQANLCKYAIS
jgi:hypothetical protein